MISVNSQNNVTYFKGRCVEIRDCDWAVRALHKQFPHFSTSKFQPLFIKFVKSKKFVIKNTKQINTNENILVDLVLRNYGLKKLFKVPILKSLAQKIDNYLQKRKDIKKISNIKNLLNRVDDIRVKIYDFTKGISIYEMLYVMEHYHIGNCSEEATLMELILKMNGVKNACTASLKSCRDEVDHLVCVFNKDGSPFKGKVTNSTIIVDPWAGKADFAKNLLVYYRNVMAKSLNMLNSRNKNIDVNQKLGLKYFDKLALTELDIEALKRDYPNLVFHNEKRKFMQK